MISPRSLFLIVALSLAGTLRAELSPAEHAAQMMRGLELFDGSVAKLLTEHCLKCHGGEKGSKGGLDLATRESLLKGGDEGASIVPGDATASYLMKLVRHEDDPAMPKKAAQLPAESIATLAAWIDLGAPYGKPLLDGKLTRDRSQVTDRDRAWWAFAPLANPAVPPVKNTTWSRTAVDRFVLSKLEEKELTPNPEAAKQTLIRRAYLDLIGLPPSPDQVAAFLADPAPDAWEKVLDQLLASPHYGERWGRHWLDLARYAESHGYEQDYDRPNAFHYRDFVIRALNDDLPFDRFLQWQIAGDQLAPGNVEAWKATGFLAAGTHATQITANQAEKERYDELDDLAATIGTSMLGLTIGCARCHDHKFDPIPTRDYYRLIATFTKTVRSDLPIDLAPEKTQATRVAYEREHAALLAARAAYEREQLPAKFADWEAANRAADVERAALLECFRSSVDPDWQRLNAAIEAHEQARPKPELTPVLISSEGVPAVRLHTQGPDFYEQTFLLRRGDLKQKEEPAAPGFLQVLMRAPEQRWAAPAAAETRPPGSRAALAKWITDAESGAGQLAARVIVNRLWQHHFGRGLVATPSDFGAQGERPTNPELLDWLAGELIAHRWQLKPLHKLLMSSAVYRQSADANAAAKAVDPANTLFWRHTRARLEGEIVRDAILATTGTLDSRMFGAGTLDPAMRRRSIYFQIKRSALPPMLTTFDAPDTLGSLGLRSNTTVAPQALFLMNNEHVRSAVRTWAQTLANLAVEAAVERAYQVALSRPPRADEAASALAFLRTQTASYQAVGKPAPAELALTDFCQSLVSLNEFVFAD